MGHAANRSRLGPDGPLRGAAGRLLGPWVYLPHYLRFDADHIVALADDGVTERRNLQLLCPYCNRVKGTQGSHGYRLKMTELRADNTRTGVMVDEQKAVLTGKRLVQHHRGVCATQPDHDSRDQRHVK